MSPVIDTEMRGDTISSFQNLDQAKVRALFWAHDCDVKINVVVVMYSIAHPWGAQGPQKKASFSL